MKAFCQRAEEKNVFTFSILLPLLLLLFVFLSTLGQKASNAQETNKETNALSCNNGIMAGLTKQPRAITLKSFKVVLLFFLQLFCNADFLKKLHALKAFGETVQSTFCTPLQKKKKKSKKKSFCNIGRTSQAYKATADESLFETMIYVNRSFLQLVCREKKTTSLRGSYFFSALEIFIFCD